MDYRLLGKSGLRVSELALGTMTFGEDWGWGANKDESRKMFDSFVAAGGNFIDTADGYTGGTSERMVGEFIAQDRERFVVATKFSFNGKPGDPNAGGNHRKRMVEALNGCLKRLKVDYVDLYWVHAWDELTPVEEVMRGLDDLVRAGKILYTGISDAPAWWISRANTIAELRGWSPFAGLQVEYNLVERTVERELLPMARALGLGVTAWSPLASGLLSGKYLPGSTEEKRLEKAPSFEKLSERNLAISSTVVEVAREVGRSPAQVALNWLRAKSGVIPILGARKLSQFEDNLRCAEWSLQPQQVTHLDAASHIELGFPTDFLHRKEVRDFLHGGLFDRIHP
ncbi:MAG TPA: aldo/keto reductase [Candidatus Limnocylindria bacterium]|jgi:aryl-alcohol dehydrogenase-like predicted oxidoreductase|nr:aldo/keto reductase [Candidatus Limnocylindria bacterium]